MLLPLLRSRAQGEIIAWIMLHPEEQFALVDLARLLGLSPPTVMREVDRLAEAGLVSETRKGNQRLVKARTDNAVFAPLAALMEATFGPTPVLRDLLAPFAAEDTIREAFIYGSWAARHAERSGPVPNDIDVLVIGDIDLDSLDDVASQASERLHREVNIRRVRPGVWDGAVDDAFRRTVTSRPMVSLIPGDAA